MTEQAKNIMEQAKQTAASATQKAQETAGAAQKSVADTVRDSPLPVSANGHASKRELSGRLLERLLDVSLRGPHSKWFEVFRHCNACK